jgi:hypothetical protein
MIIFTIIIYAIIMFNIIILTIIIFVVVIFTVIIITVIITTIIIFDDQNSRLRRSAAINRNSPPGLRTCSPVARPSV